MSAGKVIIAILIAVAVLFPYATFVRMHHLEGAKDVGMLNVHARPAVQQRITQVEVEQLNAVIEQAQKTLSESRSIAQRERSPKDTQEEDHDANLSLLRYPITPAQTAPSSLGTVKSQNISVSRSFTFPTHTVTTVAAATTAQVSATVTSKLNDLVVGLGTGISPENLAIFSGSLRAVNPTAALVLYLDAPLPDSHRAIVKKYGITAIEFSVSLLEPPFLRNYHPSNYRWPLLYRYLREHAGMYRKIVVADVRDTMFQTDPFQAFETGFYAFNGVETRTIGECGWNGGWVRDCFGPGMLGRLSNKHIICSGVSMGSASEVLDYLRLMSETMETKQFANCERNGVDQGVHNVLVHTQQIPGLKVLDQRSGWVANMQAKSAVINDFNQVSNQRGNLVAIVHQYDRFRQLQKEYLNRFIFWSMPSEEKRCGRFQIVEDMDLFKKKCDLRVAKGHSNGDCCERCLTTKGCKGWSAAGSQCFLKSCSTPQTKVKMRGIASGYLL